MNNQAFIECLLSSLKAHGFTLGVDHYLRMQEVLRLAGADQKLSELKYLLCPVFAVSEKQQVEFYKIFDHCSTLFATSTKQEDKAKAATVKAAGGFHKPLKARVWPYVTAGIVLLIAIFAGVFFYNPPVNVEPKTGQEPKLPDSGKQTSETDQPEPVKPGSPAVLREKRNYWYSIRWTAAALPLLYFVLSYFYSENRRKAALERKPAGKPPFLWPIQLERTEPDFLKTSSFYKAARALRTRVESRIMRIDIQSTIRKTMNNMGYLNLAYSQLTRPPEYLMLIDLPVPGDMYSYYADTLAWLLKSEGIHIEKYFYSRDPQVCYSWETGKRYELSELQGRFREHRLIIAGECEGLLDPLSGDLVSWVELLKIWPERAVFTPKSPEKWGMKELRLSREFVVVPATVEGLEALTAHYEDPSIQRLTGWSEIKSPCVEAQSGQIEALRSYLGRGAFQWLCACAVYPELNWNLMLSLSRFQDKEDLTEENLLKLLKLPWFRQGEIPGEHRDSLIRELNYERLTVVREEICKILEDNEPPKESEAWNRYQLILAVHKWMVSKERRRQLKKIQEALKEVDENTIVQDYTLLRLVDKPKGLLSWILPDKLARKFYKKGIPAFGVKSGINAVLSIALSFALFFLISKAVSKTKEVELKIGSQTMSFVYIEPGTFMMGSPEDEPGRDSDEIRHDVKLTQGFYMQTTEVTQGQWKTVMGNNPSYFKNCGDDCPVERVSWNEVQEFIKKLNELDVGENKYRLPTEAEWEYAARAGTTTPFAFGKCLSTDEANYDGKYPLEGCPKGEYREKTISVGSLKANSWGLYDMHGNVWEWVQDWYGDYPKGSVVDPTGPESGSGRVVRGGSWDDDARDCRSATRYNAQPDNRHHDLGFRVCLLRS